MYEIFERLLLLHGVTSYQVAKATGIATATLSDWKRGRSTPKQDKLQKIADYFDVPLSYLISGEKETHDVSPDVLSLLQNVAKRRKVQKILDYSLELQDSDLTIIIEMLEVLREKALEIDELKKKESQKMKG